MVKLTAVKFPACLEGTVVNHGILDVASDDTSQGDL